MNGLGAPRPVSPPELGVGSAVVRASAAVVRASAAVVRVVVVRASQSLPSLAHWQVPRDRP